MATKEFFTDKDYEWIRGLSANELVKYVKESTSLVHPIYSRYKEALNNARKRIKNYPEALAYSKSSPIYKQILILTEKNPKRVYGISTNNSFIEKLGKTKSGQNALRHYLKINITFLSRETATFSDWEKVMNKTIKNVEEEVNKDNTSNEVLKLKKSEFEDFFDIYTNFREKEKAYGGKYEVWRKILEYRKQTNFADLSVAYFTYALDKIIEHDLTGKPLPSDVEELLENGYTLGSNTVEDKRLRKQSNKGRNN